jgi:hypothetical protein
LLLLCSTLLARESSDGERTPTWLAPEGGRPTQGAHEEAGVERDAEEDADDAADAAEECTIVASTAFGLPFVVRGDAPPPPATTAAGALAPLDAIGGSRDAMLLLLLILHHKTPSVF